MWIKNLRFCYGLTGPKSFRGVRETGPRSGSVTRDHSDHGASKEPVNPWPEWIRRFLWCTMIYIGRDTRCDKSLRHDTSPRQVDATNRLVWHVKIIVAATEFCRCDLSHEFELIWIRATNRSDKISTSSLVATCVRICDKSLRQNLNQLMRTHHLVFCHVKFELVYISSLPKSIACTEQVSYSSDNY